MAILFKQLTYEDATFFAKGDQDLDKLIEKIKPWISMELL